MSEEIGTIVEQVARVSGNGQIVHLRATCDGRPICPVCGEMWETGAEPPYHGSGELDGNGLPLVAPSYSCSCGTEFGFDDYENGSIESAWIWLREKWLAKIGRSEAAISQLRRNLGLDV